MFNLLDNFLTTRCPLIYCTYLLTFVQAQTMRRIKSWIVIRCWKISLELIILRQFTPIAPASNEPKLVCTMSVTLEKDILILINKQTDILYKQPQYGDQTKSFYYLLEIIPRDNCCKQNLRQQIYNNKSPKLPTFNELIKSDSDGFVFSVGFVWSNFIKRRNNCNGAGNIYLSLRKDWKP